MSICLNLKILGRVKAHATFALPSQVVLIFYRAAVQESHKVLKVGDRSDLVLDVVASIAL
jgi:hypothetical protein